jgi:pimeloyl-ACP methyl ester carboxylesterase
MTEKTPLLLLPGLLCDPLLWAHQVKHLSDLADITVADLTKHDSVVDMAAAAIEGMPEKFALAGLSMGGYCAQEVMRQARGRVTRLALLDTSARADSAEQTRRRRGLISLAKTGKFKGVTPKLLPLLLHPDRLEDDALTSEVMQMSENVGRDAFFLQQTAIMNRPDGLADLAKIDCPTLILCGRQDALTGVELHEEMAAGIKGAKLVIVEDCGHLSTMEQPEAVTAVMRYWLQD